MKVRPVRRCKAQRADGQPCAAWAIVGGSVCRVHGGSSPRARQAAAERQARDSWARQFEHAERRLVERRLAWWTERVEFVASRTGEDPVELARELASPVARGAVALWLPEGVGWPVGLRPEDEPQLRLDRRFGPRAGR